MSLEKFFHLPDFNSIQGRLSLLFLSFVILVFTSVGVTYWGIERQEKDALIINLAGRQRMLVQEMARLSQALGQENDPQDLAALSAAESTFDQTLSALLDGGEAPYLPGKTVDVPPVTSPRIRDQFVDIEGSWARFQSLLSQLREAPPGSQDRLEAAGEVEELFPSLVQEVDLAVRLFEDAATNKVRQLRALQVGFLVSAVLLLAVGGWMTRDILIKPLNELSRIAERMGEGDLVTPVEVTGLAEVDLLSKTLEGMRAELKSSQEQLISWSDTLESRVDQRTKELEALYEISRDISSRLEVKQVLGAITEKSLHLLEGDVAVLCRLDQDQDMLVFEAQSGADDAVKGEATEIVGNLTSQVLSGREAFSCGEEYCAGGCNILDRRYRTSHVAAPLWVEDHLIGALCVGRADENSFPPEAASLLTKLANSAAVALENARLYEQAEKVAALEERQRIAADMHDGLGQTLSSLSMKIDRANELINTGQPGEAGKLLDEGYNILDLAMGDLRRAIASLMTKDPPRRDFEDRLRDLVQDHQRGDPPEVSWNGRVDGPLRITPRDAEEILKVVNEAVINAKRHGWASKVRVLLEKDKERYRLIIQDDGVGFDVRAVDKQGGEHFGIRVMRARAQQIGGNLNIRSAPDQGTRVTLEWPVEQDRHHG